MFFAPVGIKLSGEDLQRQERYKHHRDNTRPPHGGIVYIIAD
jgi:hypothetical protein